MWLLGVVVRRYIDFLILFIPTPLVSVLFYSSIYYIILYSYSVADRQKVAVDAVLSDLHGWLLFCAADQQKPAIDAVLSDLHSRLLFCAADR